MHSRLVGSVRVVASNCQYCRQRVKTACRVRDRNQYRAALLLQWLNLQLLPKSALQRALDAVAMAVAA
jgi:hypothetical protein